MISGVWEIGVLSTNNDLVPLAYFRDCLHQFLLIFLFGSSRALIGLLGTLGPVQTCQTDQTQSKRL